MNAKGYPNLNTAGEIVTSQVDLPFLQINLRKNIAKYPDWVWGFLGGVNKNGIVFKNRYFRPRILKLIDINIPDRVFENGVWFHPMSLSLESDPRSYDEVKINAGFHEIVPEDATKFKTVNGKKIYEKYVRRRIKVGKPPEYPTEPQPLDRDGRVMENPKPEDIVILRHRNLQELDLGKLLLK